jgi:hypothetical protein
MIKTFEELRSHIWDQRQYELENIIDWLEGSTEYTRGRLEGMIMTYDAILSTLRTSLKYGEPEELKEIPAPW